MPTVTEYQDLAQRLSSALHLATAPVAITFSESAPEGIASFDEPMSEPASDGRRGRVPAGCVFWVHGANETFVTAPEDHGNCSVGRYTHGMASLDDVADNADVATLLGSGWVTPEAVGQIPAVKSRPGAVTYGPLAETPIEPDVVLLRVNGRQMMVLSDSMPGLRIEGKPQCHIIAIAKNDEVAAASVGCALSRARTGMTPEEMTCALPASKLGEIVASIEATSAIDSAVAKYAAADARRFNA